MKKIFNMTRSFYLIVLSVIVSFLLLLLLYGTIKLEEKIETKMVSISTIDVLAIVKNSATLIQDTLDKNQNLSEQILNDENLQNKIEKKLELLITPNIKYAYLLYKDSRGVFRFLADGASSKEKAFPNQKFDIETSQWLDIYTNKKPLSIEHKYLQELSISYLFPILNNKKDVELILVIDFSIKKIEEINEIITLMKNGIILIVSIVILFLFILIIQTIKYLNIKKSSFIDKLTNVYNRNYLHELQNNLNLNDYILSTLDIDFFKKINDTFGHDVGDKVLKEVANTILLSVRDKEDIVIRYGGEEFIILTKVKNNQHQSALNVIERILKIIEEHKFYYNEENFLKLTVSIGVNLFPSKSKNFMEAFKLADISLYEAKKKGRNNIQIYQKN